MAAIRVVPLATAGGYGILRRVIRDPSFGIADGPKWLAVAAFGGGLLGTFMGIVPAASEAAYLASTADIIDVAWDLIAPTPVVAAAARQNAYAAQEQFARRSTGSYSGMGMGAGQRREEIVR